MKRIEYPWKFRRPFDNDQNKCAVMAIGYMFGLNRNTMMTLLTKLIQYKGEGLSTIECRKTIQMISLIKGYHVEYHRKRMSFKTWSKSHRKGHYLLNQDGHVSCIKNGLIIDGWNPENWTVEGWWEIMTVAEQRRRERKAKAAGPVRAISYIPCGTL